LVFDEATSSLDSKSEQAILAALAEVAAQHPTLMIAHRLSTVTGANRIIVLKQGRIVEEGNHKELLGIDGIYAHMYRTLSESASV